MRQTSSGIELLVHLAPRAARDAVCGEFNGRLKVSVTSPPVDSKANKHLIRFLADRLKTAKGNIEICAGETSRDKAVLIRGLKYEDVEKGLS